MSPTEGKGSAQVSVTATGGSSGSTGTITLSSTEDSKTVTVNVKYGKPGMDPFMFVVPSIINIDSRAQTVTFGVSSNVVWQITSNASWCSVSPITGADSKTVTVTV